MHMPFAEQVTGQPILHHFQNNISRLNQEMFSDIIHMQEARLQHGLYTTNELFEWVAPTGVDKAGLYLLIGHAIKTGTLLRLFKGVYKVASSTAPASRMAVRAAKLLKPQHFSYVSMESILFSAGVIKTPPPFTTMVTAGTPGLYRWDGVISIEFFHTVRQWDNLSPHLSMGEDGLWYADAELAYRDLRLFRPNHEKVNARLLADEVRQLRLVG